MTHTVGWPEINISFQVKKCVEINKIQLNRANARSTKKTQAEKKKKKWDWLLVEKNKLYTL